MTEQEKQMWQDDLDMISKLNKENKELHNRIDKAIEFIEHKEYGDEYSNFVVPIGEDNGCPEWACEQLLEILKGEE